MRERRSPHIFFFVTPKATTQLPLTCKCVKLCLPIGYAYSLLHFFLVKEHTHTRSESWCIFFSRDLGAFACYDWTTFVKKKCTTSSEVTVAHRFLRATEVKKEKKQKGKLCKCVTKNDALCICLNEKYRETKNPMVCQPIQLPFVVLNRYSRPTVHFSSNSNSHRGPSVR